MGTGNDIRELIRTRFIIIANFTVTTNGLRHLSHV